MKYPAAAALVALFLLTSCSSDPGTNPTNPGTGPDLHHLAYDGNGANGGTAPVDDANYEAGANADVAAPGTLTRTGFLFVDWNTEAAGGGQSFVPGSTLVFGATDTTLYAQWNEEVINPGGWDPALGSWTYWGVTAGQGLSDVAVDYCRLALDSMDRPVVGFSVTAPGGTEPKQQVRRWNGVAFDDLGGSGFSVGGTVRWFDLVCGASDHPWVSTTSNSSDGYTYTHDGSNWSTPVRLTSDQTTYQTSLTTNSSGNPVVAFRFTPGGDSAIGVRVWGGTAWEQYAAPFHLTSTDNNTAITVINDVPFVAFANSMQYAQVINNPTGAAWNQVGASPAHPSNSANSFAMAQDSHGRPWLVFRQGGHVHVQYYDGSTWVALDNSALYNSVDMSSTPQTMDIVMVGDVPVITFVSRIAPRGVRVVAWSESRNTWVNLGGVGSVGQYLSSFPDLAIDGDGRILLGYVDQAAGGQMSLKVYAPGS